MLALLVGLDEATSCLPGSSHRVLICRLGRCESPLPPWVFAFGCAALPNTAGEAPGGSASLLGKMQNVHPVPTSPSRRQVPLSLGTAAFLQRRKSACWDAGTPGLNPSQDFCANGAGVRPIHGNRLRAEGSGGDVRLGNHGGCDSWEGSHLNPDQARQPVLSRRGGVPGSAQGQERLSVREGGQQPSKKCLLYFSTERFPDCSSTR